MVDQRQSSSNDNLGRFGEKDEVLNVRAEMMKRRGLVGGLIDDIGRRLSHAPFFITLLLVHLVWVLLNIRLIAGLEPWDPYPFVFLATVASVEAPFISLLVLMRQHRDERVAELREETDLQVSLHLERELTVAVRMLREIQHSLKVQTSVDAESLEHMQKPLDPAHLLDHLKRHLGEVEGEEERGTEG